MADPAGMDELLVEVFLEAYAKAPEELILDLDATDDPLHGKQEGRFFHATTNATLPAPVHLLWRASVVCATPVVGSRGRRGGAGTEGDREAAAGGVAPGADHGCGDSDFSKDELMLWCETEGVDYVFGLAQNPRLKQPIATAMEVVRQRRQASGKAEREFQELRYQTLDTWTRERRVVATCRGERTRDSS